MNIESIKFALVMLDEIRKEHGCDSSVYNECVDFFQALCNYDKHKLFSRYSQVLYNPITKKHEMVDL